jgi:hypothetical protein
MPLDEIRAVVEAGDARTVHRLLALHRERLEERLAEQQRNLGVLERYLIERAKAMARSDPGPVPTRVA